MVIGYHANWRLRKRGIPAWQAVAGLGGARLLRERPRDRPNPVIEVEQLLADGTPIKAVWAWMKADEAAKLLTVHYLDGLP